MRPGPLIILLAGLAGAPTPVLAGQDDAGLSQQAPNPRDCEHWQARVRELSESEAAFERAIAELYAPPESAFCQHETIRLDGDDEDVRDFELPNPAVLAWTARALAIALLVGLVLWLIRRTLNQPARRATKGRDVQPAPDAPRTVAEASPASLPDDIPAAARSAWAAGDPRRALGLLYGGAANALVPARRARVLTEREVLGELRGCAGAQAESVVFMRALIEQWQLAAWAGRAPDTKRFEALCRQWPEHCRQAGSER